jgi:hypothetical protein
LTPGVAQGEGPEIKPQYHKKRESRILMKRKYSLLFVKQKGGQKALSSHF